MEKNGRKEVIVLKNIKQSFVVGDETVRVLSESSFSIEEGSFNIIFGPSGSGKSTLLNILSGLQKPTAGSATFFANDIYSFKPDQLAFFRANQIGVVYQTSYWVNSLNVIENVSIPLFFLGLMRKDAEKRAMDALQRVDMAPYAKKSPLVLSGGEQQRVAMARAIVADPAFIIADEPTGSLDSKNGEMIMSLLQSYNKDLKRTIVLVTHNMEYLPLSDHLIEITDGKCVSLGKENALKVTDKLIAEMKARIGRLRQAGNK